MGTIRSDGNVLEDLATYDNSIWQKVKSWITKAIKNIKAVYESLSPNSRAAQVLSETMTDMDKLERLFTEGVKEAGERAATAEVETRTEGEKVYSFTPADFEKPITMHDIEVLRGIGRRSINKFSSEDIKKPRSGHTSSIRRREQNLRSSGHGLEIGGRMTQKQSCQLFL